MKLPKPFKYFLFLIILGIIFLGYCHMETRWIRVNTIRINADNIPASFDGKRIVFISDIHLGPFFSRERVKGLVNRINKLNPDIIIMGGDYVHREPIYIKPLFEELKKLNSRYGIYAVLGNHDHWENANLTRESMLASGIKICDNRSYWVRIDNDSIKIGGVGDVWEDEQLLDSTIHDLQPEDFCILISHNPDYQENMQSDLVDLTLSGHTHGGQMTFFGVWAPVLPSKYGQKYRYGLKSNPTMKSYITSGIGTITPPLRFFCRPEIVLFEMKKE